MKKKYFLHKFTITYGEYEQSDAIILNKDKFTFEDAQEWFWPNPSPNDFASDSWFFNGGEVAVTWEVCQEITKKEADVLKKFNLA